MNNISYEEISITLEEMEKRQKELKREKTARELKYMDEFHNEIDRYIEENMMSEKYAHLSVDEKLVIYHRVLYEKTEDLKRKVSKRYIGERPLNILKKYEVKRLSNIFKITQAYNREIYEDNGAIIDIKTKAQQEMLYIMEEFEGDSDIYNFMRSLFHLITLSDSSYPINYKFKNDIYLIKRITGVFYYKQLGDERDRKHLQWLESLELR